MIRHNGYYTAGMTTARPSRYGEGGPVGLAECRAKPTVPPAPIPGRGETEAVIAEGRRIIRRELGFPETIDDGPHGGKQMLVLTREINQRIYIGDDIIITIVGQTGRGIKVGIEAPPGVRVDREEVRRRIEGGEPRRRRPRDC